MISKDILCDSDLEENELWKTTHMYILPRMYLFDEHKNSVIYRRTEYFNDKVGTGEDGSRIEFGIVEISDRLNDIYNHNAKGIEDAKKNKQELEIE